MLVNEYGDNLMIALLARTFARSITVVSATGARTWHADGAETKGVAADAVWVVHLGEHHYYGVLWPTELPPPGGETEAARRARLGLVRDDCPLCTAAVTCAIHRSTAGSSTDRAAQTGQPLARDDDDTKGIDPPPPVQVGSRFLKRVRLRRKTKPPRVPPASRMPPTRRNGAGAARGQCRVAIKVKTKPTQPQPRAALKKNPAGHDGRWLATHVWQLWA